MSDLAELPVYSYQRVELVNFMNEVYSNKKLANISVSLVSHFYAYKKTKQFLSEAKVKSDK